MITTTVAGRTWEFSHAIGRNAATGNGFSSPTAIAAAGDGVIYVLSRGHDGGNIGITVANQRIGKMTVDEEFIGEFGKQEFTFPTGLAVDKDGNLYCSDEHKNIIAVYDADGQRLGEWGVAGTEPGQLNGPAGICFDSANDFYVVDAINARVQKFTKDGEYLLGWGEPGDGRGQFNRPWGITADSDGNVYVADWGNDRVQKFTADGEFLQVIGGPTEGPASLLRPADVAVDSEGDIYVTDWGNKVVKIYDSYGDSITSLQGDATKFSKWAQEVIDANPDATKAYNRVEDITPLYRFDRPTGIAVDEEDRIIVTDSNRGRLQVYSKVKDYSEPQFNL